MRGVPRIDADRLIEVCERAIEIAGAARVRPRLKERRCGVRRKVERRRVVCDGPCAIALGVPRIAAADEHGCAFGSSRIA